MIGFLVGLLGLCSRPLKRFDVRVRLACQLLFEDGLPLPEVFDLLVVGLDLPYERRELVLLDRGGIDLAEIRANYLAGP